MLATLPLPLVCLTGGGMWDACAPFRTTVFDSVLTRTQIKSFWWSVYFLESNVNMLIISRGRSCRFFYLFFHISKRRIAKRNPNNSAFSRALPEDVEGEGSGITPGGLRFDLHARISLRHVTGCRGTCCCREIRFGRLLNELFPARSYLCPQSFDSAPPGRICNGHVTKGNKKVKGK